METIYLYCVTRKGLSLPANLKGVGENPLNLILWQELASVCSVISSERRADPPPPFTLQDLFLHKEVVEYVHAFRPVVPMRFTTTLKDTKKVAEFLQKHSLLLEETLDRLEDEVEISLRVILDRKVDSPIPASESEERPVRPRWKNGIEYLRQKKQVHEREYQHSQRAQEVYVALNHKLRPLVTESKLESNWPMSSIYYLVRRNRLEEFERVLREIKGGLPEKVLYSGPWPPYSFVPEFLEI